MTYFNYIETILSKYNHSYDDLESAKINGEEDIALDEFAIVCKNTTVDDDLVKDLDLLLNNQRPKYFARSVIYNSVVLKFKNDRYIEMRIYLPDVILTAYNHRTYKCFNCKYYKNLVDRDTTLPSECFKCNASLEIPNEYMSKFHIDVLYHMLKKFPQLEKYTQDIHYAINAISDLAVIKNAYESEPYNSDAVLAEVKICCDPCHNCGAPNCKHCPNFYKQQ